MADINNLPTLRWGIIATGMIASWFVSDLTLKRGSPRALHRITAIGSSSTAKASAFAHTYLSGVQPLPACYSSYDAVFADPNVDIVYIATPHSLHAPLCLNAIAAGKHVLCEKAFALNAREARAVVAAARAKGVFVMEAMWLRFIPLVETVQNLLHKQRVIGDVRRVFCDFGLNMPIRSLPKESRLKDPNLGAGSLLDIGIYSLTWGIITLERPLLDGTRVEEPLVTAQQVVEGGIDIASSFLMKYPTSGSQGILTSSLEVKTDNKFCRIEGTTGCMEIGGASASMPDTVTVELYGESEGKDMGDKTGSGRREVKHYNFEHPDGGRGFYYEADAVAIDIAKGKTESGIMPLDETLRLMRIMDGIRKAGGATFAQDD